MGDNRATLDRTVEAMFRGDYDTAVEALAPDGVVEYPQSGERLAGPAACLNVYRNYPGGSPSYELRGIRGGPDVFVVEATADYGGEKVFATSIVEFRDGRIVRQTDYWSNPFPAPEWRAQWVDKPS
jgi:ketosteroid isomerase-like protein